MRHKQLFMPTFCLAGLLLTALSFSNGLANTPTQNTSIATDNRPPKDDALNTLFQQTYQAVQQGRREAVQADIAKLKHHPLYPWLIYEDLRNNFEQSSDQAIIDFVEAYPNSIMSDDLYEKWAQRLADKSQWSMLLQHIPATLPDNSLQCFRALALDKTGEVDQALALAQRIWNDTETGLPSTCLDVIALLNAQGRLSEQDYWQRISQSMRENHVTFSLALAKQLPDSKQALVQLWANIRKDPKAYLPKTYQETDSPELREIIVYGLERASLKSLDQAKALWNDVKDKFLFTAAELGAINSDFGMWEAWRQQYAALKRFRTIKPEHRTANGNEWMARIALRFSAWDDVLDAIHAMSPEMANENTWQYWKARALLAKQQTAEANAILKNLAHNATFYGFLAADQLGEDYQTLQQAIPDRTQRIQGLEKLAAVSRWQAWTALNDKTHARKEWFRLLKAMDKEGILAAAALAQQRGDSNLAIWSVSRTQDWNVVDLRFPMDYQPLVQQFSQEQGVPPAWIYGVMRRESAFDPNAMSSVKALGLMQLMPATARGVAKQLGLDIRANADILEPVNNVQLGSAYLKDMLGKFSGDYARATAAYNAGPYRIPKWTPKSTIQADQWIESIPFKETRNYVQAVMAYTTIYDFKLNPQQYQRLSERLKPIQNEGS